MLNFFTIVDVDRKIIAGFSRGHFVLEGLGDYCSQIYKVEFQNENLIIWLENRVSSFWHRLHFSGKEFYLIIFVSSALLQYQI